MYLTNPAIDADLVVALKEDAIKCVIDTIMLQRPSLFNYATQGFIDKPQLLERYPIPSHPSLKQYKQKLITLLDSGIPLYRIKKNQDHPIGSGNGKDHYNFSPIAELNFFAQVTTIQIEFSPGVLFAMPVGLPPLPDHHFSIRLGVTVGVGFPTLKTNLIHGLRQTIPDSKFVLAIETVNKFPMEVVLTGSVTNVIENSHKGISIVIDGFEIMDLKPDGLEGFLENYVKMEIGSVLIPELLDYVNVKYPDLVYKIRMPDKSNMGIHLPKSVDVTLTPVSNSLPVNPDFENDTLEVCVHMVEVES